jgi:hypothetical protein
METLRFVTALTAISPWILSETIKILPYLHNLFLQDPFKYFHFRKDQGLLLLQEQLWDLPSLISNGSCGELS